VRARYAKMTREERVALAKKAVRAREAKRARGRPLRIAEPAAVDLPQESDRVVLLEVPAVLADDHVLGIVVQRPDSSRRSLLASS
jgi:hypothetical protein